MLTISNLENIIKRNIIIANNIIYRLTITSKKISKTFSLNIVPKNDIAKKLYEKLGYKETQRSESHSIKMEKKA